jgi:hypothetical protein
MFGDKLCSCGARSPRSVDLRQTRHRQTCHKLKQWESILVLTNSIRTSICFRLNRSDRKGICSHIVIWVKLIVHNLFRYSHEFVIIVICIIKFDSILSFSYLFRPDNFRVVCMSFRLAPRYREHLCNAPGIIIHPTF